MIVEKNKTVICGLSQKLRHKSNKVHEENVYQIKIYVCSPKFKKIGQETFFSYKGLNLFNDPYYQC